MVRWTAADENTTSFSRSADAVVVFTVESSPFDRYESWRSRAYVFAPEPGAAFRAAA